MSDIDGVMQQDGQTWYRYSDQRVASDEAILVTFKDTEGRALPFLTTTETWRPIAGRLPAVWLPVRQAMFVGGVDGPRFMVSCDALGALLAERATEPRLVRHDPLTATGFDPVASDRRARERERAEAQVPASLEELFAPYGYDLPETTSTDRQDPEAGA